jgi:hypothetical protein
MRESGMKVIGIGGRKLQFIDLCDRFVYIEVSGWSNQKKEQRTATDLKPSPKSLNKVEPSNYRINESTIEDMAMIADEFLGDVGNLIVKKKKPEFDPGIMVFKTYSDVEIIIFLK